MQNILARTKVDDVITIKKSQYQNTPTLSNNIKPHSNKAPILSENQPQF